MVGVRDVHLAAVGWLFEAREREPVLPIHFLSGSGEVHILGVNHLPRHHFVHALRHARHEVHAGPDLSCSGIQFHFLSHLRIAL
jgi:hypothetical protein